MSTRPGTNPPVYPDLAGFDQILLEGARVEKLVVRDDLVLADVEVALLGDHPDYAPPPRGELHCRARMVIEWRRPRAVSWDPTGQPEPWIVHDLAVGPGGGSYDLVGSFGRVHIEGSAPRVKRSKAA